MESSSRAQAQAQTQTESRDAAAAALKSSPSLMHMLQKELKRLFSQTLRTTSTTFMFMFALILMILLASMAYTIIRKPSVLESSFSYTTLLGILLVLGIVLFVYQDNQSPGVFAAATSGVQYRRVLMIGFSVAIAAVFLWLYQRSQQTDSIGLLLRSLTPSVSFLLIAGGIVFGLAMIYQMFQSILLRQHGFVAFLTQVVFFIPCLMIDLMQTLTNATSATTDPAAAAAAAATASSDIQFKLFMGMVVCITLYLAYPQYERQREAQLAKSMLQHQPLYLSNPVIIRDSSKLCLRSAMKVQDQWNNKCGLPINNFSVSAWIHFNPPSGGEMIANHENHIQILGLYEVHPDPSSSTFAVEWMYRRSTMDCTFLFYKEVMTTTAAAAAAAATPTPQIVQYSKVVRIPLQKWCHVVINVHDNVMDVFIDGQLQWLATTAADAADAAVAVTNMTAISAANSSPICILGESDHPTAAAGIGALCSVELNNMALSRYAIAQRYNQGVNRNPPI